eukprot:Awhi_evm1s15762
MYAAEMLLPKSLPSTKYHTVNAEEADFFLIPFYYSCAFHTKLYHSNPSPIFTRAMNLVINNFPYFNRSLGKDHIIISSHDFSTEILLNVLSELNPQARPHFLTTTSDTLMGFDNSYDVALPPYIAPSFWGHDVVHNVKSYSIAWFRGSIGKNWYLKGKGFVREELKKMNKMKSTGGNLQLTIEDQMDQGGYFDSLYYKYWKPYRYMLSNAKFCLSPIGFQFWSPRLYESFFEGCTCVFIHEGYEPSRKIYLPFQKFNITDLCISIGINELPMLLDKLASIPDEELEKIRNRSNQYANIYLTMDSSMWNHIIQALLAK